MDIRIVILGQLGRLAPLGILEIQLGLAGSVGDIGYMFSVRRPLSVTFVRSRSTGDIFRNPFIYRDIEYLATSRHHHTLTFWGEAGTRDIFGAILDLATCVDIIGGEGYVHFLRFLRRRIHFIDIASILENDRIPEAAREFHVVLGEVRHLTCLFCLRIVNEQVHRVIPIRKEIDLITNPHRKDILRLIVRNILYTFLLRIIHPDIIGHTALIVFPCTELTHYPVVSQLFSVGRIATKAALGQGNHLGKATFFIYRI